jgi:conjugative relaxase-like TrwC/TraI family protein
MMTITKIGGGNAAGYYTLENGYAGYLAKESQAYGEPEGQWFGKAIDDFKLDANQPPTLEQMSRLLAGFDANSGEPLLKGAGQENRVQAFDCCLSPPKSISALFAALSDSKKGDVLNAQEKAVQKALSFLEQVAGSCRTGHGGSERIEVGKLLMATFEHSTSRENDPQIHHHCVIMNLIASGGKVRTLDASLIYNWSRTIGAIYHAELAASFKELGYGVEAKGDKQVFEIVGVPDDLMGHWSKRKNQVEAVLDEMGADSSDHIAKKHASLSSRKKKGEINRNELFEQWLEEAKAFEFEPEKIKGMKSIEQEYNPDEILNELTESKSVLTIKDIYQVVALRSVGSVGADAISKRVESMKEQMIYLGCDDREAYYTTHETISREQAIIDMALSRQNEGKHKVDASLIDSVAKAKGLLPEQKKMVEHICLNDDGIVNISGFAGAGKSFSLDAVRQVYEAKGYKSIGVAPSGKAADGLKIGAGIPSSTIHKLLIQIEMYNKYGKGKPPIDEHTIIICDEAGMMDNKLLCELLSKASDAGSKVVLVGDTEQIQSIRAGGMFRKLQEKLGKVELTQVFRQKDKHDIQALSHLRAGEAKLALNNYAERGLVSVDKNQREAMQHLVDDWLVGGYENSIILASTNKDVGALNRLARRRLKAEGKLIGEDVDVVSEGRKLKLAIGDRIVFKKNQKPKKDKKRYNLSVRNGELGEVISIHITKAGHDVIRVRMDDGREEEFRSRDYDNFSYGLAISNHRSQGATFEKSYVYSSSVNTMINKEMAYVAMSRAKQSSKLYFTEQAFSDEEKERMYSLMSRSSQLEVALDKNNNYRSELPWQSKTVLDELLRIPRHADT